ncbi:hypothetical protein TNCV_4997811 [Trichonephila clavipes]|nr:hypothetical protein TNCV_4997811 [Trichonephila clavipes]
MLFLRERRPNILTNFHIYNIYLDVYHPPNQRCLPDSFLDLAAASVPSLFIGDLNVNHTFWACSSNNSRGFAADNRTLLFLNEGFPTYHSLRYNTEKALDIALARADVFSSCQWSVLDNIRSDYLFLKIELKKS